MKVLFACEESGYPSELFATRGHSVTSCDLLPGSNIVLRKHIQGDAIEIINSQKWDAVIGFPPCTFTCRASAAHINSPGRRQSALAAIEFAKKIFRSNVPLVAIENPIGFLNTHLSPASQIIYPWMFGDNYSKDIALWLRGFPKLVPSIMSASSQKLRPVSNHVNSRMPQALKSQIKSSWRHFPGMSAAIADQWSAFLHASPGTPVNTLF